MFSQPVDPVNDEAPDYFDIIKKPMDFGTIEHKLENNEYTTVHDWKTDIQLVFSNAVQYNGRGSAIAVIAGELQHIFRNLAKTVSDNPETTWMDKLLQYRRDLNEHLTNSPLSGAKNQISSPSTASIAEMKRFVVKSMTKKELDQLTKNLRKLKDPEQIEQLKTIVRHCNPDIDINRQIDMNFLTPKTLSKLREYVTAELEKRGDSY